MSAPLPNIHTPAEAARRLGCNERRLRKIARDLGACSEIGKTMILTDDNLRAILEATSPCHSRSTDAAPSGTTGAPLPAGDYEALRTLRTRKSPSKSSARSTGGHGKVISMGRRQF